MTGQESKVIHALVRTFNGHGNGQSVPTRKGPLDQGAIQFVHCVGQALGNWTSGAPLLFALGFIHLRTIFLCSSGRMRERVIFEEVVLEMYSL